MINKVLSSESVEFNQCTTEYPNADAKEHHCHERYELLYVVRGNCRLCIEGNELILSPGSLLLLKPFQYHSVAIDDSDKYERFVIHFAAEAIIREIRMRFELLLDTMEGHIGIYYAPNRLPGTIKRVLFHFNDASHVAKEERDLFFRLLISELICLMSVSMRKVIVQNDRELGAKLARYINDHIDWDISLDAIAKHFFMSKYYMCHVFKEYSGVSIHAYITQKRLALARQMMALGNTAAVSAYKVGFGDYSAFYRAYVKAYGKPPTSV